MTNQSRRPWAEDTSPSLAVIDPGVRLLAALVVKSAADIRKANQDFDNAVQAAEFLLDMAPDILQTLGINAQPESVRAWVLSGCKKQARLLEQKRS